MTPLDPALADRREAVVRAHMQHENDLDFDATLATFAHPRYELIATGEVFDGADEVMGYYATSRAAFPDQSNEIRKIHRAADAVIVEFDLMGTHLGPLRGIPATGHTFRCPMIAVFVFEDELIVNERVYFDASTILAQLGLT
jgi:steroid delta-isomerase-like uncharacterized protein